MKRTAFTMLELIFVIVIMGIIGKFGTEFLAEAYKGFIFSSTNNVLQSRSAKTVEFVASRLQHRIKDSVIARTGTNLAPGAPVGIGSATGNNFTILEWVSTDMDGFRGDTKPYWSGIIDFDAPTASATTLVSPDTNTTAINALISALSGSNSDISDAAIYFIGSNNDINSYGYVGGLANQNGSIHPIDASASAALNDFTSSNGSDFTGIDLYEYYKLTWTANAIIWTAANGGTLTYYYDYQPWTGDTLASNDTKSEIIMEGISTFQFMSIGSIMKIQVCAGSDLVEDYSLCKEKTIF